MPREWWQTERLSERLETFQVDAWHPFTYVRPRDMHWIYVSQESLHLLLSEIDALRAPAKAAAVPERATINGASQSFVESVEAIKKGSMPELQRRLSALIREREAVGEKLTQAAAEDALEEYAPRGRIRQAYKDLVREPLRAGRPKGVVKKNSPL